MIKELSNISKEKALADYEKLEEVGCDGLSKISPFSKIGNKFVDHFTYPQKIETKGKSNINFFEFWDKRFQYAKKPYIQRILDYEKKKRPDNSAVKMWKSIYNLYFSAITIFRPLVAMGIYCRYKPQCVLDFTMGWGGRLVGACAVDVPKYIGIDLNKSLKKPYADMIKMLKPLTDTKIDVRFQDALKVDYSKLDYDMVFTSPPYYNLEIYEGTEKKSKDDWDEQFYKPIFTKTWTHLKKGGHYCLNVPREVYERVCLDIFGKADELIPLEKVERHKAGQAKDPSKKYGEFIYVWKK